MVGSTGTKTVASLVITGLLCVGCKDVPVPAESEACDANGMRIIGALLTDAELNSFASKYLSGARDLQVVWNEHPSAPQTCQTVNLTFTVTSSSAPTREESNRFVAIHKMFYDDSAAFVEIALYPTGKRADFFLRKDGEWKVVQHAFREVNSIQERITEQIVEQEAK